MNETKLEEWYVIVPPNVSAYTAPELIIPRLVGVVYNHPKKIDGTLVTVSNIIAIEGEVVVTKNTRYTLGIPEEDYEKEFPGARQRFLDSVKAKLDYASN